MPEQPLSDQLALITGAGNATGRAIAMELARQGAAVVLHDAPDAPGAAHAQSTAEAIVQAGGRAGAVTGNLAHVEDCLRIVDEAAAILGGLDILVNHAEVAAAAPLSDVSPAAFDQALHTNMRAAFFCSQQAVRRMEARGGGSIVNMGSVATFAGVADYSLYATTKGAIGGFSRQLAVELIPYNIRVNALAPGYITTDHSVAETGAAPAQNSWGRAGAPEDLGRMVAFLASPAAGFMNGQVLYLDGGLTSRLAIYQPTVNTQELGR